MALGLGVASFVLLCSPSLAVPMWARRYSVACTTCHAWPSFQMTSTGLDFLRRGHRLKGDGFDKDVTHLIAGHVEWQYNFAQGQSNPFQSPEFHLYAGGALTSLFAGFVHANINNTLEAAYAQFTKEKGDDVYFTARGGKFNPTLIRDYGSGLGAGASSPLVLSQAVLTTNPFAPGDARAGVDLAVRWKALFLQSGVVNGADVAGLANVNNHKDFYATGEVAAPDGVSGLGLYYFRGGYDLGDPTVAPQLFDRYDRTGVFANFTRDTFRVAGAYLYGKDHLGKLPDRKMHGYFAQVDVRPGEWLVPFARYDDTTSEDENGKNRVRQANLGVTFQLFQNDWTGGRLTVEGARREEGHAHTYSGLFNILWAF